MIRIKQTVFSVALIFLNSFVVSQVPDTIYAREVINQLTAEGMHGRGYVNNGDQLAANYIQQVFKKNNLASFAVNYEQPFTFSVNTFPGTLNFMITARGKDTKGKKTFEGKPAVNMLIGAGSSATNRSFTIVIFDSTYTTSEEAFKKFKQYIKSASSTLILVDDRMVLDKKKLEYYKMVKANYFEAAGVIEFKKKLTHTVSQQLNTYISIQLLTDSFQLDITNLKKLKAKLIIENNFLPAHVATNLVGYIPGAVYPDSFIVFAAHYDHLGQLGKEIYFPGANDNASGCAMLLNLLRYYSVPANKPSYSIAFMAFAGEEVGLVGSSYYTTHPLFPLSSISFLLNMDMMGTGIDGITVVNGTLFKSEFEKLKELNASFNFLKEIRVRGKAANSDHYPFSEKGVPAFFMYTLGGIAAYHDIYDKSETLPLTKFEETGQLIIKFTDYLQRRFIQLDTK